MIRIAVSGACGRMGRRIVALSAEDGDLKLSGALEAEGSPYLNKKVSEVVGIPGLGEIKITCNIEDILKQTDALIEFSTPEATLSHLRPLEETKKAIIIGTTGFNEQQLGRIKDAAAQIPIVMAPNMSLGVNVLFALTEKAAGLLGQGYDMEVIEAHHHFKKDAPSGTAKKLAQIMARARNLNLDKVAVYGRSGLSGPRPEKEIGIHAVRAGDIVGEHTVIFAGTGERLELVHRAQSRDTFAYGALQATKFVASKPAGLYDMQDVLGLK